MLTINNKSFGKELAQFAYEHKLKQIPFPINYETYEAFIEE